MSVASLGVPAKLPPEGPMAQTCHSYQPLWLSLIQPQPFQGHAIRPKPQWRRVLGPAPQVSFCESGVDPRQFPLSSILRDAESAPDTPHWKILFYSSVRSSPMKRRGTYVIRIIALPGFTPFYVQSIYLSPRLPCEMFGALNYFSYFTVEGTEDGRG